MSIRHLFIGLVLLGLISISAVRTIVRAEPVVGGGAMPPTLTCFSVYLPMTIGGGETAVSQQLQSENGLAPPQTDNPGNQCQTFADFNGDGFDDLVIGVIAEEVDGVDGTGAANIINGSVTGLWAVDNLLLHRNLDDVLGANSTNDHFSEKVAYGDFNGDGYTDLVVSSPNASRQGVANAGTVHAFYGSAAGITAVGNQMWSQAGDINGALEDDHFGEALAVADFNGDGFDDLAVGVPRENVGALEDAGAVNIIFGSIDGLTVLDNQIWTDDALGVFSVSQEGDFFGRALAAADFNADGYDDLAIGVPNQDLGQGVAIEDAGTVVILFGSANGPTVDNGFQLWSQAGDILGVVEEFDRFGTALTTGDFNGDGLADLAVGVPNEIISGEAAAGAVNILYGTDNGLSADNNQIWTQNSAGFLGNSAEAGDRFGFSLTSADYNGDGYFDLAIGAPYEGVNEIPSAGSVEVLFGSVNGLSDVAYQFLSQINSSIEGSADLVDLFGWSVSSGDYNGDGYADLAVGVPIDTAAGIPNAGAVNVLYGMSDGLSLDDDDLWSQASAGISGTSENGDLFGYALP